MGNTYRLKLAFFEDGKDVDGIAAKSFRYRRNAKQDNRRARREHARIIGAGLAELAIEAEERAHDALMADLDSWPDCVWSPWDDDIDVPPYNIDYYNSQEYADECLRELSAWEEYDEYLDRNGLGYGITHFS